MIIQDLSEPSTWQAGGDRGIDPAQAIKLN
jgi:hypothetical protein